MAIKDLEVRQGNVDIVLDIVEVGEVKEFEKFGKSGRVASATAKDETGEIKLSLWNEQIDQIKAGDKVHITNGYVNEFQGEMQLTTGKFGKLEVVESGAEGSAKEAPAEASGSAEPAAQEPSSEPEIKEESVEEKVE